MFHFPGCPPVNLLIQFTVTGHCPGRVPPFGYPWIKAYLQLPMAFRSLSRPSSAISALASTLRSYSLDLYASSTCIAFLRLLRCDTSIFLSLISQKSVSFLCSFQGAMTTAGRLSVWSLEFGVWSLKCAQNRFLCAALLVLFRLREVSCEPSKRYRQEIQSVPRLFASAI